MKLFDLSEQPHGTKHQRSGIPLLDTDPSQQHPRWEGSRLQLQRLQVCASGGKQQEKGSAASAKFFSARAPWPTEGNLIPRPVSVPPFVLF